DVDAIVAGRVDREGGRRRVDLHRMTRLHAAQVERDVAGGDLELQEIGLLVDETQLRVTPRAHERARADLELEVAAVAGGRPVAGGHSRPTARRARESSDVSDGDQRYFVGIMMVRHMCAEGLASQPSPSFGCLKWRPTTSVNSSSSTLTFGSKAYRSLTQI